MRLRLIILFSFILVHVLFSKIYSQTIYRYFDSIPVVKNGDTLSLAFAGGFNNPQFNSIDLNQDGLLDIVVFDKSLNVIKPFLNKGGFNEINYKYAPEYISSFPQNIHDFMMFRDYNCDNQPDIFSQGSGGILVYRNDFLTTGNLSFTQVTPSYIVSDYGLPFLVNVWNASSDIPGVEDLDQDGDLDLLVFPLSSNSLEEHKSRATDINDCDSLAYEFITQCWGHFYENSLDNGIVFNYFCKGGGFNSDSTLDGSRHAGSTVFPLDLDLDVDKDVLIGDISYTNLIALTNGGDINTAHMTVMDSAFPSYDTPVDIIFPAAHYLDVDNDGVKDLVVSSNATGVSNNYESAWFYKNNGITDSLVLHFEQSDLFQNDMIEVGEGSYPTFFDYNADGLLDLVIGNYGYYTPSGIYSSKLTLYENIGTALEPSFNFITNDYASISSLSIQGASPTCGGLVGDGDFDLIIGDYSGRIHYLNNVAGSGNVANFQVAALNYIGIDVGDHAVPQLYDVNDDGLLDLLIGETSGTINYFENSGTITNAVFSVTPTNSNLGQTDVSPQCCTGYSTPYMTKNTNGNRILYIGSEYGKIYTYENIDGNVSGTFLLTDSIEEVQGRISVTGANIYGLTDEELLVGSYLGGVTLLKSDDDVYVDSKIQNRYDLIQIFPNPFGNQIVIKNEYSENAHFVLTDLYGRIMLDESLTNKFSMIDTKSISSGVYIIYVESLNEKVYYKVIKP